MKVQQFTNEIQEFWSNLISSDTIKGIIDFGTKAIDIIGDVTGALGELGTVFTAIGIGSGVFNITKGKGLFGDITSLKSNYDKASQSITKYNNIASKSSEAQARLNNTLSKSTTSMGNYLYGLNGAQASMGGYIKSLVTSTIKTIGLQAATIALNAALSFGISIVISGLIKLWDHFAKAEERAIEASEQAADTIKTISDDFKNTEETVSSISERFAELAQGVDLFNGKNISLNDEEYAEFLDLSNQLAEIFPTLSRNYDENGNAIVQLSGDTDTMVGSLERLLEVERQLTNQKIAEELPDLYEGVAAKSENYQEDIEKLKSSRDTYVKALEDLQSEDFTSDFNKALEQGLGNVSISVGDISPEEQLRLSIVYENIFDELGVESIYDGFKDGELNFSVDAFGLTDDEIEQVKSNLAVKIQDIAKTYSDEINDLNASIQTKTAENKANWSTLLSSISAWLETDLSYSVLPDEMKSIAQSMINAVDFSSLNFENWEDLQEHLQETILDPIENASVQNQKIVAEAWNNLFALDIDKSSANDYITKANEYIDTIAKALELNDEEKAQLKLTLGIDTSEMENQVDDMRKQIEESLPELSSKELDSMTLSELQIAVKVKDDASEQVGEEAKSIVESELKDLEEGGNVDLHVRPQIDTSELSKAGWKDVGEGIATVFSSTISNTDFQDLIPENVDDTVAINFTPIVTDENGNYVKTLSKEALYSYAHDVLAGVKTDDLNIQMGATFEGKNAIAQAEAAAIKIHELHEQYFLEEAYSDDIYQQATKNALEKQMDVYKYLGENAVTNAQDVLNNLGLSYTTEPVEIDVTANTEAFEKTVNGYLKNSSNPINRLNSSQVQKILDQPLFLDKSFLNNVDNHISKVNELQIALGKFGDGTLDDSDLDRLKDLGVETSNINELDDSIRNMLNGMNSDIIGEFKSQFGKIKTTQDRKELEAFMNSVIDLGLVVGNTSFSIDIATESAGYENLAAAMQESVSATGLSVESITNLKNRYADFENVIGDFDVLFEETTNGIHLNRDALNKLEDAYENQNIEGLNDKLDGLKKNYDVLTEAIDNCTSAEQLNSLYSQRDALAEEIRATAELANQYEGLTSAYSKWQREQDAGNERDMYEGVISGFEEVKDEMSRGWFDDDTVAFLELLTGENLSTKPIEDQIAAYKRLDDTINSAGYSVKDFFTVDSDGNSTSKGVYNFLDTVDAAFKNSDVVKIDDDGNYSFNFNLLDEFDEDGNLIKNGDKVIAEALGISEELVQIILRAADDAGFTINLDGAYTQLADLKTSAEEANDSLKSLYTKSDGKFGINYDFNFEATGEELVSELSKAEELLDQYRVDGKVDMSISGAQEALEIYYYLSSVYDRLNEPAYMNLNVDDVEEELQEPLEKLQEFERLSREEHRLELIGDTKALEETQEQMDGIVEDLSKLDKETKISLGIEGDSPEEIRKKLENGEIEFPATATVDLQVEMNDSIEEMLLLMKHEAGLISDEELKLKVKYGIDSTEVDDWEPEDKEAVVEFLEEHPEVNEYEPEVKDVLVRYKAEGENFDELTDKEKEIVIKYGYAPANPDEATQKKIDEILTEDRIEKSVVLSFAGNTDSDMNALLNTMTELEQGKSITIEAEVDGKGLKEIEAIKNEDNTITYEIEYAGKTRELSLLPTMDGSVLFTIKAEDEATPVIDAISQDEIKDKIVKLVGEDEATPVIEIWNTLSADPKFATLSAEDQASTVVAYWNSLEAEDKQAFMNGEITLTDSTQVATDSANENIDSIPLDPTSNITAKDFTAIPIKNATTALDKLDGKTVHTYIVTHKSTKGDNDLAGTAHASGTVRELYPIPKLSGRALAMGTLQDDSWLRDNWRTKKDETALVGEEGMELVATRQNRWFTVGENGAEFANIPAGSVVFNAKQTEELLTKGHINSRGKAYLGGTAYSSGSGLSWATVTGAVSQSSSGSKSSNSNSNSNSSDSAEEFEETLDWIERKIKAIEREIDNLDKTASAAYKVWSTRNSALTDEIAKVNEEISIQQQAYQRYMKEADSVGLSDKYKKLVQEGKIDIETIKDEELAEKISEYQDYYDKAIQAKDAVQDLQDNLADLAKTRFDGVVQQFENLLSVIEHTLELTENSIDKIESQGYLVNVDMYKALKEQQEEQLATLQDELSTLQTSLTTALEEGNIEVYSDDWYELTGKIQDVESEISSLNNDLVETNNLIRETPWNIFDKLQEMISTVQSEGDWLIDLMSDEKMFDEDTAKITEQGQATLGLHAVNYNAYMSQADDYAKEIEKINKEIAEDPYNTILLDRREELLEQQRDMISNAEDEKQAMKDLVEEGYNAFLDVMDKAIDKRKELLSTTKDLYDYEKNVAEQTKEIANLEKQLQAYSGDTSEDAKATIQQIKVSLEEAKESLEETEYDRYISDQEQMLDTLRDETEQWINQRLDDLDLLVKGVIESTNANAETIKTTLETETQKVGTTLSEAMSIIWSPKGDFAAVITTYGDNFSSAITTTNLILGEIKKYLAAMAGEDGKDSGDDKTDTPKQENPEQETPGQETPKQETPKQETPKKEETKTITVGGKINAGSAKIYGYAGDTSGSNQFYKNDPIYTVLSEENGYLKVRHHKLSSGVTGWFKKSDVKAYKTGGLVDYDGLAMVHGGKKPEMVLNAKDTENFVALKNVLQRIDSQDLISSLQKSVDTFKPFADFAFIHNIPQTATRFSSQDISIQIGDIQMYGVNDPETFAVQLKHALQTNKSVKNIIQADTLGIMTGKNGLSKFKY